jgi:hypothetical protein
MRKPLLRMAQEAGAAALVAHIHVPADVAVCRDQGRIGSAIVGEAVIRRMAAALQPPCRPCRCCGLRGAAAVAARGDARGEPASSDVRDAAAATRTTAVRASSGVRDADATTPTTALRADANGGGGGGYLDLERAVSVCVDATAPPHEVARAVIRAVADDRAWIRLPPAAKGVDAAVLDAARARTAASWLHQADLELRACVAQLVRTGTVAPAWAPGTAAAVGQAADGAPAVAGNGAAAAAAEDGGTPAACSGLPATAASGQAAQAARSVTTAMEVCTQLLASRSENPPSSPAAAPLHSATTDAAPKVGVPTPRIDAAGVVPAGGTTERRADDGRVADAAHEQGCTLSAVTAATAGVETQAMARHAGAGSCVASHSPFVGGPGDTSTAGPVDSPATGTEPSRPSLALGTVAERLSAAARIPLAWPRERVAEAANAARKAALVAIRPVLLSAASADVDAVAAAGGDEDSRSRAGSASAGSASAGSASAGSASAGSASAGSASAGSASAGTKQTCEPGGVRQDMGGWLKLRVRAEFAAQLRGLLPLTTP